MRVGGGGDTVATAERSNFEACTDYQFWEGKAPGQEVNWVLCTVLAQSHQLCNKIEYLRFFSKVRVTLLDNACINRNEK